MPGRGGWHGRDANPWLGTALWPGGASGGGQIFTNYCGACHALKRGERALGQSLLGVPNRPAGSVPGFAYSDGLKKSGLVWTEDNLRKWVANSVALVPSTLMPHVSISDSAEQIYVVAFLRTLKARPGQ